MSFIDPVDTFLSGFSSLWSRLVIFLIAVVMGHTIGMICACIVWLDGSIEFRTAYLYFDFLPFGWLWYFAFCFFHIGGPFCGAAVLYGFFYLLWTEKPAIYAIAVVLLAQSWHTFIIHTWIIPPATLNWPEPVGGAMAMAMISALLVATYVVYYLWEQDVIYPLHDDFHPPR